MGVAYLARCGIGRPRTPGTRAHEGSSLMEGALDRDEGFSFTERRESRSWWWCCSCPRQERKRKPKSPKGWGAIGKITTTGASEVKSYRRRGKTTPAPLSEIFRGGVHAPISIHRSECGVVKTLLHSRGPSPAVPKHREASQAVARRFGISPLETHEMRVHVTADSVGIYWSVSSWLGPFAARVSAQRKHGRTLDGADAQREGE